MSASCKNFLEWDFLWKHVLLAEKVRLKDSFLKKNDPIALEIINLSSLDHFLSSPKIELQVKK